VGGERIEVVVHARADIPTAIERIRPFGDGDAVLDEHTKRITLPSAGGAQALVQVVGALNEASIAIDDIGVRRPTLDDVFLSLTGHAAVAADEAEPAGATATAVTGRAA
jgi:ABC-2 type transport system ATP-binding protein